MVRHLKIAVLGPLDLQVDGRPAPLTSEPQRIVLACLALSPGQPVGADVLIDVLWGDDPTDNARGNLQSYVSRLRRLVGADRIALEPGGYRLDVPAEGVDVGRAERLATEARETVDDDPAASTERLGEALSLWRGEALVDLDHVLAFAPERARLSALRRRLWLEHTALRLSAGDAADMLPALQSAAATDCLDEVVHGLYMRGLHQVGRTAEALRVGEQYRRRLVEESGLDPGPGHVALVQRLLTGRPDEVSPRSPPQPPPRRAETSGTPATPTGSWPHFTTALHGRRRELAAIDSLVGRERLVTLTGPGGVGKTRLASAATEGHDESGQEVIYLPLGSVQGREPLDEVLAGTIGLRVEAGRTMLAALQERLGSGGHLLVIDNCEHVLDEVRDLVAGLLSARGDLCILTTSRIPLGMAAEHIVRVGPLEGRTDEGGLGLPPAVRLFVERTQRVRSGWEPTEDSLAIIEGIVDRLGGLPLAIELAAGRLTSISLADLDTHLDSALDLLVGGRPTAEARHRSLRATLDWSYRLLGPDEQRLLRHLTAFPGGADLAAVHTIGSSLGLPGDGTVELAALVDASMVDASIADSAVDERPRYTMLQPIRVFARRHLEEAGEQEAARSILARWVRDCAARVERLGTGPDEHLADELLRSELANLRAAHAIARNVGDLDTAIDISAALRIASTERDLPEVGSWALDLAADPGLSGHPRRAEALGAAAAAAWLRGDLDGSERLSREGLRADPECLACLDNLGSVELFRGDPGRSFEIWSEASERDPEIICRAALAAAYAGDPTRARQIAERGLQRGESASPSFLAMCRYAIGESCGPGEEAIAHYRSAVELARGVGSTFVEGIARVGLASTHAALGRTREALEEFDWLVRYWRRTGSWTQQWTTLRNLATLVDDLGEGATAEMLWTAADGAEEAPASARPPSRREPGAGDGLSRSEAVDLALATLERLSSR